MFQKTWRTLILFTVLGLMGLYLQISCGKSKSEGGGGAEGTPTAVGQLQIGDASKAMTSTATNVDAVYEDFRPGSLAVASSQGLNLQQGGDPCAGVGGLFSCQPKLLKIYIEMARLGLNVAKGQMETIAQQIGSVNVPSSGERRGSPGQMPMQWNFQSKDQFRVLAKTSPTGPWSFYVNVNQNTYEILADDSRSGGYFYSKITYQSDSEWTVEAASFERVCDTNNPRSPKVIVIRMNRSQDLWKGKAMMYSPLWLDAGLSRNTCSTTEATSTRVNIFTDIVGNGQNSSAALYMLSEDVATADDFLNWPGSAFCSKFSNARCALDGSGVGETLPISSFTNPFCVTVGQDAAAWGAACSSSVSDISTPTFGDSSAWMLPSDVMSYTHTMPTTILE